MSQRASVVILMADSLRRRLSVSASCVISRSYDLGANSFITKL
jgi:hypothetical protein